MRKFAFIVIGVLALILGIAPAASAAPVDADTNGSQPGTHTYIVVNPYGGARGVLYAQREAAAPYPWNTYKWVPVLAVSQDVAPGIQSHRIRIGTQSGAGADIGLQTNWFDTGLGQTVGQVGGWDDFRTGAGSAGAGSPVLSVEFQQGQGEGDGPFNCPVLTIRLNAQNAPGTANSSLLTGCNP